VSRVQFKNTGKGLQNKQLDQVKLHMSVGMYSELKKGSELVKKNFTLESRL